MCIIRLNTHSHLLLAVALAKRTNTQRLATFQNDNYLSEIGKSLTGRDGVQAVNRRPPIVAARVRARSASETFFVDKLALSH